MHDRLVRGVAPSGHLLLGSVGRTRLCWATVALLLPILGILSACGGLSNGVTSPTAASQQSPSRSPAPAPPPSPAPPSPTPAPTPAPPSPTPAPPPPAPAPPPPPASPCSIIGGASSRRAVVNGTDCSSGNSPVVLINVRNSSGAINFTCSGTVVGARAVLTAGHCLAGAASADVDLGGEDIPGVSLQVSPGYRAGDPSSLDVAVLLTGQDLGRPAFPLLSSRDPAVGEQAIVAGWGLDGNGVGRTLRAGSNTISGVGPFFVQTQYQPGGSGSGVCTGDSGGPLLVSQGGWAIAGVASSISAACTAAGTDSFANVRNQDAAAFIASLVPDLGGR